jgi:hypothetical protein
MISPGLLLRKGVLTVNWGDALTVALLVFDSLVDRYLSRQSIRTSPGTPLPSRLVPGATQTPTTRGDQSAAALATSRASAELTTPVRSAPQEGQ